jgi:hypothetical protein
MKKLLLFFMLQFAFGAIHSQTIWTNQTTFSGFVGKYEIRMKLAIPYGGATSCFTIGEYYYTNSKGKIFLCSSDDVKIVESVNGKETGYFILDSDWNKKVGQTISGKWYSLSKRVSYPVVLKVIAKARV